MELGIFAYTFVRQTVEQVMDAIQVHGLAHTEWNHTAIGLPQVPDQVDGDLARRVRTAAAERGIAVDSVAGYVNMIHPDPARRQADLERLMGLIRAAPSFGAGIVALCTGTRDSDNMWRRHPANDDPEAWTDLRASMATVVPVAEAHDVTLSFEPEVNNVVDSAAKARRLLDEIASPHLKVTVDGANIFHRGELERMHDLLTESIELLAGDIALAHAKDLDRDGDAGHVPAGHGKLDYEHYIGLLKRAGFDGPILLHGLQEDQAKGCIRYVRRFLDAPTERGA
jgi:sugar phosphate isomerase/epimerase